MTLAPVLFAVGIAFGYFVVLPGAVGFLQNFNASSFDALVQERSYYQFVLFRLLATGIFFQIPIAGIGLNRMGCVNADATRSSRSLRPRCPQLRLDDLGPFGLMLPARREQASRTLMHAVVDAVAAASRAAAQVRILLGTWPCGQVTAIVDCERRRVRHLLLLEQPAPGQ